MRNISAGHLTRYAIWLCQPDLFTVDEDETRLKFFGVCLLGVQLLRNSHLAGCSCRSGVYEPAFNRNYLGGLSRVMASDCSHIHACMRACLIYAQRYWKRRPHFYISLHISYCIVLIFMLRNRCCWLHHFRIVVDCNIKASPYINTSCVCEWDCSFYVGDFYMCVCTCVWV